MGKYQKAQREFLSTPHGALGTQRVNQGRCSYNKHLFQLHTVHQEPLRGRFEMIPVDLSFNSTRCIRNRFHLPTSLHPFDLSTPHGALGTMRKSLRTSFCLSTPHGALGTDLSLYSNLSGNIFQLHTVHQELLCEINPKLLKHAFNSTRCIRNNMLTSCPAKPTFLSTPHGALGTLSQAYTPLEVLTFNSTRCIRNPLGGGLR